MQTKLERIAESEGYHEEPYTRIGYVRLREGQAL